MSWLVGFNVVSTLLGHLMPNNLILIKVQTIQFSISTDFVYKQLNVKTVLFQTVQFSIRIQFSSI